jgi:hypothetical protein
MRVFATEFAIGKARVCTPYVEGIYPNSMNLEFHQTRFNRWVMRILSEMKDSALFRGWFYLVSLGVLLSLFWIGHWRNRAAGLLIGLSGLLYALAYVFVSTACDFRMHWWTVLTVFLLALLAMAGISRAAPSEPAP